MSNALENRNNHAYTRYFFGSAAVKDLGSLTDWDSKSKADVHPFSLLNAAVLVSTVLLEPSVAIVLGQTMTRA
jgi:hypothetical protein